VKKGSVDSPNKTTTQVLASSDEDWSPCEEHGFPWLWWGQWSPPWNNEKWVSGEKTETDRHPITDRQIILRNIFKREFYKMAYCKWIAI